MADEINSEEKSSNKDERKINPSKKDDATQSEKNSSENMLSDQEDLTENEQSTPEKEEDEPSPKEKVADEGEEKNEQDEKGDKEEERKVDETSGKSSDGRLMDVILGVDFYQKEAFNHVIQRDAGKITVNPEGISQLKTKYESEFKGKQKTLVQLFEERERWIQGNIKNLIQDKEKVLKEYSLEHPFYVDIKQELVDVQENIVKKKKDRDTKKDELKELYKSLQTKKNEIQKKAFDERLEEFQKHKKEVVESVEKNISEENNTYHDSSKQEHDNVRREYYQLLSNLWQKADEQIKAIDTRISDLGDGLVTFINSHFAYILSIPAVLAAGYFFALFADNIQLQLPNGGLLFLFSSMVSFLAKVGVESSQPTQVIPIGILLVIWTILLGIVYFFVKRLEEEYSKKRKEQATIRDGEKNVFSFFEYFINRLTSTKESRRVEHLLNWKYALPWIFAVGFLIIVTAYYGATSSVQIDAIAAAITHQAIGALFALAIGFVYFIAIHYRPSDLKKLQKTSRALIYFLIALFVVFYLLYAVHWVRYNWEEPFDFTPTGNDYLYFKVFLMLGLFLIASLMSGLLIGWLIHYRTLVSAREGKVSEAFYYRRFYENLTSFYDELDNGHKKKQEKELNDQFNLLYQLLLEAIRIQNIETNHVLGNNIKSDVDNDLRKKIRQLIRYVKNNV